MHVRYHTLAYVPSSGVVYAFGCNNYGQLGTGIFREAISPFPVKTKLLTISFNRSGECRLYMFKPGNDFSEEFCKIYKM